jgi:hypothetical protein
LKADFVECSGVSMEEVEELQEAQTKIMEALSVINQAPLSNENLVTQIDLQNLKKELSTELKN